MVPDDPEFFRTDLRDPARGDPLVFTSRVLPSWFRHAFLLCGVFLLCVVILVGSAPLAPTQGWRTGSPFALSPALYGAEVVGDLVWDPLHPRLAYLALAEPAAALVVWDLAGHGMQRIDLVSLAGEGHPRFDHVLWARNDQRVAVTFTTDSQRGVLLFDHAGLLMQRLLVAGEHGNAITRWDLVAGTANPLALVDAPAYRWEANQLVATTLTPTASIGVPNGDAEFSLWQPGILLPNGQDGQWVTFPYACWSPDGRILVQSLVQQATVMRRPASLTPAFQPQPPRDAALDGLLSQGHPQYLAWRPDGEILAAFDGQRVTLHRTRTGQVQTQLLPSAPSPQSVVVGAVSDAILTWSPDGHRLALLDAPRGVITVWFLLLP